MDENRIADIEDLIIAAVKEAIPDAAVETRSVPLTEENMKEMLGKAPFVYVEYAGGARVRASEESKSRLRSSEFNLFIAATSLRSKQEAQRGSYELLAKTYNSLDGSILTDTESGKRAGPFAWLSEAAVFVDTAGTVYQSVYTLTEI